MRKRPSIGEQLVIANIDSNVVNPSHGGIQRADLAHDLCYAAGGNHDLSQNSFTNATAALT